jgi:hypothetical protein
MEAVAVVVRAVLISSSRTAMATRQISWRAPVLQ